MGVFWFQEQTGLRNNSPTRSSIVGVEKNSHVFEGGGGSLVPNKLPPTTPHTTKTRVAKLMNSYLAEVARDPNLPLAKFQALAGSLPKFPYASDDGLYRAIDTYLKVITTISFQKPLNTVSTKKSLLFHIGFPLCIVFRFTHVLLDLNLAIT
jgi:hypothetical protein